MEYVENFILFQQDARQQTVLARDRQIVLARDHRIAWKRLKAGAAEAAPVIRGAGPKEPKPRALVLILIRGVPIMGSRQHDSGVKDRKPTSPMRASPQPTGRPTHRHTDTPARTGARNCATGNQPTSPMRATARPTDRRANPHTRQTTNRPADQPTSRPADQPTSRPPPTFFLSLRTALCSCALCTVIFKQAECGFVHKPPLVRLQHAVASPASGWRLAGEPAADCRQTSAGSSTLRRWFVHNPG